VSRDSLFFFFFTSPQGLPSRTHPVHVRGQSCPERRRFLRAAGFDPSLTAGCKYYYWRLLTQFYNPMTVTFLPVVTPNPVRLSASKLPSDGMPAVQRRCLLLTHSSR